MSRGDAELVLVASAADLTQEDVAERIERFVDGLVDSTRHHLAEAGSTS